jgi:hypothetical protein
MTYEECQTIIDQFEKSHPNVVMSPNTHGIQVVFDGKEYVLQLVVTARLKPTFLKSDEVMPKSFSYERNGKTHTIKTAVFESEIPQPNVLQGALASYSITWVPYGTAGWHVYFPKKDIWGCLSNHHVLVDPNNPHANLDVYLGLDCRHRAQLHAFVLNATWDYALARYHKPADANPHFRPCADGSRYPAPHRLAGTITIGAMYYKVGARPPVCRTGRLRGISNRQVGPYPDGTYRYFRGQLVFEKMTDLGDSGCLMVREHDNAATGLHFSSNHTESLANPLLTIGWKYLGLIKLDGGQEIPMYDVTNSVVPT